MNALVIEQYAPATYAFIDGLHAFTRCGVRHDETMEAGLRTMEQAYCDIVLVTIASPSMSAPKIVEQIQSLAVDIGVRPPEIIVLFDNSIPLPDSLKCRELGAMSMLRDLEQAVYEEARLMFWRRAARKHQITIRVDYRNGHHFLYGGATPIQISMGTQITRLAILLLGGHESYAVEFLADQLGICRQSVKKYLLDLRRAFEPALRGSGLEGREDQIFWMEKRSGGSVCGVKANVIWN